MLVMFVIVVIETDPKVDTIPIHAVKFAARPALLLCTLRRLWPDGFSR